MREVLKRVFLVLCVMKTVCGPHFGVYFFCIVYLWS